jgi:hypothetical protein
VDGVERASERVLTVRPQVPVDVERGRDVLVPEVSEWALARLMSPAL